MALPGAVRPPRRRLRPSRAQRCSGAFQLTNQRFGVSALASVFLAYNAADSRLAAGLGGDVTGGSWYPNVLVPEMSSACAACVVACSRDGVCACSGLGRCVSGVFQRAGGGRAVGAPDSPQLHPGPPHARTQLLCIRNRHILSSAARPTPPLKSVLHTAIFRTSLAYTRCTPCSALSSSNRGSAAPASVTSFKVSSTLSPFLLVFAAPMHNACPVLTWPFQHAIRSFSCSAWLAATLRAAACCCGKPPTLSSRLPAPKVTPPQSTHAIDALTDSDQKQLRKASEV
eukprot:3663931-Rhodomonas_salina.2